MGFKETFTRSGEQESNLQYDDNAFLYFSLSCFVIILVPMIYDLFTRIFKKTSHSSLRISLNPHLSKKTALIAKRENKDNIDRFLILRLTIILILIAFLTENIIRLSEMKGPIKSFDPYETLNVGESSTIPEIKRAYRKLSLVYHPDKNPDDPLATAKFILITKAYNCLTDETMKEICAKYGNPDGPGTFSVAVALPSFLLRKDN
jgi:translocation protein SEC63